uniref:Secreted protein n=1 Tax=Steinernema glaseri TaxID=37863 RepID=A0A1I8ANB7_9BILA
MVWIHMLWVSTSRKKRVPMGGMWTSYSALNRESMAMPFRSKTASWPTPSSLPTAMSISTTITITKWILVFTKRSISFPSPSTNWATASV